MNLELLKKLSPPARYFPLDKGIYEVAPNLRTVSMDFGNGSRDQKVFQFDNQFCRYRENKIACRSERLNKYFCTHELSPELEQGTCEFIARQLSQEWPEFFNLTVTPANFVLICHLTEESIVFDPHWRWLKVLNSKLSLPYVSGLDALCCQIQEDVALTSRSEQEKEGWLSALHLCSPSHWAPESKIGKNFSAVHAPIAGSEKMNRTAPHLVDGAIRKGPYVRFVWGFGTDDRLNHHPEAPKGRDPLEWRGRTFQKESKHSPFILRLERQFLYGLPQLNAYFFAIHVYFIDGVEIRENEREKNLLRSALLSMSTESLEYKGLSHCLQEVIDWFDGKH
jgi:dimethylamine monooxygenase subunit A